MAKSQDSFNKKELEKKRRKKQEEKLERKEQRKADKASGTSKSLEEMFSYVDENGFLTTTKPDPSKKKQVNAEDIVLGASPRDFPLESAVRNGQVKFFNDEKGYGFIVDSETKDSIFVHINNITGTIRENDRVIFEIEMGPKGASAVNVQMAPKVAVAPPEPPPPINEE
jgi:cold shock CspA family protein